MLLERGKLDMDASRVDARVAELVLFTPGVLSPPSARGAAAASTDSPCTCVPFWGTSVLVSVSRVSSSSRRLLDIRFLR